MGQCISAIRNQKLSQECKDKCLEVFNQIDLDNSKSLEKKEATALWKGKFSQLNAEAIFKAVDYDKNGSISLDEWLAFWQQVRNNGYSNQDIIYELNTLQEGGSWCNYVLKNPKKNQISNIKLSPMIKNKKKQNFDLSMDEVDNNDQQNNQNDISKEENKTIRSNENDKKEQN